VRIEIRYQDPAILKDIFGVEDPQVKQVAEIEGVEVRLDRKTTEKFEGLEPLIEVVWDVTGDLVSSGIMTVIRKIAARRGATVREVPDVDSRPQYDETGNDSPQ